MARVTGKAPGGAAGFAFASGLDMVSAPDRLTDPYRKSAWVRSAIDKISGPISAVCVDFYAADAGYMGVGKGAKKSRSRAKARKYLTERGRRAVDEDEALELPVMQQLLRSPMKGLGYTDFVEATIGWLRMAGESFWLLPDSTLLPYASGGPMQIIVARPDRMRHVVQNEELLGWEFTDGKGRRHLLLPDQVIQLKQWNPYDAWRGLGQFEAAELAAEADWLAGRFARNLMANNGDTGPYIVAKNGIPSDGQREQILADLRAKRAAQLRGQFKPIFMTGDITVEDPQVRSVDAAYVLGRIENRHEVYIAMGVPPSMADVKAAYSIGSASDFYQLILNTCVPAGGKFCDGLEQLALKLTKQSVCAFLNWDEHPVFQEVRKERLASVDTLWSKGMPVCEISEYLGLGLPQFPGDDVGYLPFGAVPVDGAMPGNGNDGTNGTNDPAVDPALGEEADVVVEALRALRGPLSTGVDRFPARGQCSLSVDDTESRELTPSLGCCGCSIEERDLDVDGRDAKELAQWRELIAKRLPTIKKFRSHFDQVLMKARRQVLAKLEAKKSGTGWNPSLPVDRAAAADFLFNLANFAAEFRTAMRGVSLQAVIDSGNQLYKEVGRDDPWKAPSLDTMRFIEERENKLSNVPNEVFGRVRDSIAEQIELGGSMTDIERAVKAEFNAISDKRGKTIAQTETGAAMGFGRHKAMVSAGIQWKRWLVSGNSNVRAAHKMMNGTIVPIDQKFLVIDPKTGASDEVMHPGDASGAAWNVINCHCIEVSSMTGPEGTAEGT
jgi:hypothetical protein